MNDRPGPAIVPKTKLYATRIPVAILAEVFFYAEKESRTSSDFIRHAIRMYIDTCRKKHGAITDEQQSDFIKLIIDGGKLNPDERRRISS